MQIVRTFQFSFIVCLIVYILFYSSISIFKMKTSFKHLAQWQFMLH